MGILEFLGLRRLDISKEETARRLLEASVEELPGVIREILNGYSEEHGLYLLKLFPEKNADEKDCFLQYLAATKKWHSTRVLAEALQIFNDPDPKIRYQVVEIFPALNQDFIGILVKKLGSKEISSEFKEGINEIIKNSGVVQGLVQEYENASKKNKLKILEQLASLQNPECFDLLFEILKEEKLESKAEEKRPFQRELLKLLPFFRDRNFLVYIVPKIHFLDPSVLYEVFTTLRVFGREFFSMLVKNLANQNSGFQHKCLTIIHRLLDEDSYFSLFTTFFGNPNQAIMEETETIIGKLLRKFTEKFEKGDRASEEIIALRETILEPLENRLRDPEEDRTLFMCEHIIRIGLLWPEIFMRNIPAMCSKHLTYVQNLFKSLPENTRKDLFLQGLLFPNPETGQAILELISSSIQNYHKEIMPDIMISHFLKIIPEIQVEIIKKMLMEGSVLATYLDMLLNSIDTDKKLKVLTLLGQFDNKEAWEFIKKRISDPSQKIRGQILDMLEKSEYDNTQVVIMTIHFFKDTEEALVVKAIEILSEKNHNVILASISKMLTHNSKKVQESAKKSIILVTKRKYYQAFNQLEKNTKYQVGLSILKMDPNFLEEVAREIGHADDSRRRLLGARILEVLADHLTSDVQVHLIVAINDPDPTVRAAVIMGLGRVGGPAITNMLLEYLNDQDDRVRANTVEAFGFIGDTDVIDRILPVLEDPHNRARGNAIITLWKLGYEKVFDTIARMLGHEDKWMRSSVVFAMGELMDPRFINFLMMSLKDKDEDVRRNAIIALDKLHPTQFIPIFRQMRFDQGEKVRKEIQLILDRLKAGIPKP